MSGENEIKTEFDFELTQPFAYAFEGSSVDATFIRLKAPNSKQSRLCAVLKQAFFRALPKIDFDDTDSSAKAETDSDLDGDALIAMIAMSDVDLGEVLEVARKLFTSGLASVDGVKDLNTLMTERMSQDDWESMTGAYMANFTVASALKKMNALSSKQ